MPAIIRIALVGPPPGNPLEYGSCMQGVVYRWLKEIDPEIHDLPQTKPITIGPLRRQGADSFFELAALANGFDGALLRQIARNEPEIVLHRGAERRAFEILQISFRAVASWEDLLRRSIVLPAPELYFGGLAAAVEPLLRVADAGGAAGSGDRTDDRILLPGRHAHGPAGGPADVHRIRRPWAVRSAPAGDR